MTAAAPRLDPAPAELTAPCEGPAFIKEASLSRAQAETLWQRDRSKLAGCKDRHRATVGFYARRDKLVTGTGP